MDQAQHNAIVNFIWGVKNRAILAGTLVLATEPDGPLEELTVMRAAK